MIAFKFLRDLPPMNPAKISVAFLLLLTLAACGGSSSGSFETGGAAQLTVTPLQSSVEAQAFECTPSVQVNVRFTQADGSVVADGTSVNLAVDNAARGRIEPGSAQTSGGVAQFRFFGGSEPGRAVLIASGTNPSGAGTITGSGSIDVVENTSCGPPAPRLEISGGGSMPANVLDVPPFLGSPYLNELTVRYKAADGTAGEVAEGQVAVAIAPVSRAAFSTLDDPETEDINEFLALVGSGPVNMTAGVTTLFVHSFDSPGSVTVSVTAQDAISGERFSEDFIIEIEDGAADFLPADISFEIQPDPVYVQGSGGPTTKPLSVNVSDSGGNPVPNPEAEGASFNNVRLLLEAPAGSGARLTGTGANGSVSGTEIDVRTVNGVANFALNAGNETGSHRIIATVDRADNNVDNELQDSVEARTSINVGDGRLFALRLVSPAVNALLVNAVAADFQTDVELQIDPDTGVAVPPNPDGTYSYRVSVIATDRQGNPPLPNQPVNFGKVDSPVTASSPAMFVFSGVDGDPAEGELLFTVDNPAEGFLDDPASADEAVEVGDTLVLFGKRVPGNREHEAVRTVAEVIDDQSVMVAEPFNPNAGTGSPVDDQAVIPWAIGRSQVGFVEGSLTLDERGRGSVRLTYPVSAVGQPAVLWTQGSLFESAGATTVADAQSIVFPGVTPLTLTASPSSVRGNGEASIRVCLNDGLGTPVNGIFVRADLISGDISASLDGSALPSATSQATGSALPGCVDTLLATTGMVPEGDSARVLFSVEEASAEVEVVPPGVARMTVSPSTVTDVIPGAFRRRLTLTLRDGDDQPIPGVGLTGTCNAAGGILAVETQPGITDQNGRTNAEVLIALSGCASSLDDDTFPRIGQCEFTTSSGSPTALFTAIGIDLRSYQNFLSPPPPNPACPPLEDDGEFQLVVDVRSSGNEVSRVLSEPDGIECGLFEGADGLEEATDCISAFDSSPVLLQAPVGTAPTWSGDCTAVPDTERVASVDFDAAGSPAVCAVDFN